MDSLRWVLLAIGALLILGIYLWDLIRNKRKPKRRSEVIFNQDSTPDFQLNPNIDNNVNDTADYAEALSGLNKIRASLDAKEEDPGVVGKISAQQSQGDETGSTAEISENTKQGATVDDGLIFLRIVATAGHEFKGLRILIATKKMEMKFGNMNIFHHYGPAEDHCNKPLFSLANMFEPGEFNLQEMDSFSTKGLVVYMPLPTPLEAEMSLELLLNTSQQIARQLEGELRDVSNQILDEEKIQALRDKVQRFKS